MIVAENHIGRLVEVRLGSPLTLEEIEQCEQRMLEIAARTKNSLHICADFTRVSVLPGDLADRVASLFQRLNASIRASGILIAVDSPVAILQLERIIREAGNPARRAFRERTDLQAWLETLLTAEEQVRLREFLFPRARASLP